MSDIVNHESTAAETVRPTRRDFLRFSALGLAVPAVGTVLAACGKAAGSEAASTQAAAPVAGGAHADSNHSGGTTAPHPKTPEDIRRAADEMDRHHEAGIKAFPAKTEGKGNVVMEPRIENGVKVYEVTTEKVQWEVTPGQKVEAWTYNGQVPGPQVRVKEGDRVRFVLHNKLEESTAIHFHGLELPNDQDGVPFITQPPVKPGESYTYEFTVPEGNAGSHMYHSHHNAAKQVGLGLLGAFIVEPKSPRAIERVDVDYVMILNDGAHGYTLNGKGFPATEPIVARMGQKVRIRFMNEGMMIHPMHLHGMHMTVIDKDGWAQPAPWKCDTLNVAPGERWDVIVNCNNPGTWAFHCHVLPHAESPMGMIGMVTALVVQK
ncbi:MAG TPA: multicopper oxidase domain-containing protein [Longimicrobium sp.]|nr:multicopper oxidase domain-containing protein [Longimicrobium sp.]